MIKPMRNLTIVDMTEWCDDQLMGCSVEERTRWEGEGGFIPRPPLVPWWIYDRKGLD